MTSVRLLFLFAPLRARRIDSPSTPVCRTQISLGPLEEVLAEDRRLHRVGALLHQRRHRVERGHRGDADQQRDRHGRSQELPDRHAGGACHQQLELAGEIEEHRHRAEEDAERQHLLRDRRRAQKRQEGHLGGGDAGDVAGAAQQLHEVDHEDEAEDRREHGEDHPQESGRQVAAEGQADHGVAPIMPCLNASSAAQARRSRR